MPHAFSRLVAGRIVVAATRVALALAVLVGTTGGPSVAADLPVVIAPPPPPVVIEEGGGLCIIEAPGGSVEVFQEPRGEVWGNLPSGMIVEVMDAPYTPRTDLWVRIKPPRVSDYYGWVETSTFICI